MQKNANNQNLMQACANAAQALENFKQALELNEQQEMREMPAPNMSQDL